MPTFDMTTIACCSDGLITGPVRLAAATASFGLKVATSSTFRMPAEWRRATKFAKCEINSPNIKK